MKRIKQNKYEDAYYALVIIKELITNHRFETLVEYILLAWEKSPAFKKREILNAITIEYLNKNKKGKNNENIIKFNNNKLYN